MSKFCGLGVSMSQKDAHQSFEVQYDLGNSKSEGLFGMPLFMRAGTCYHLENKQKVQTFFSLGKQWMYKNKWEVPVDDKFKLVVTDKCDLLEFIKMSPKAAYQLGFALEMKL